MRQMLGFMLLMAAAAIGSVRYMDHAAKSGGTNAMAMATKPAAAPAPAASAGYRTVTLNNNGHGYFQVEARVEGRSIDFLVDTGASSIALRESSAAKLGIHPATRDYTIRTQTANGVGKAAPVMLESRRDQRHHRPRRPGDGGARRRPQHQSARHDVPVAGEMDPRPWPSGAGTIRLRWAIAPGHRSRRFHVPQAKARAHPQHLCL